MALASAFISSPAEAEKAGAEVAPVLLFVLPKVALIKALFLALLRSLHAGVLHVLKS